METMLTSNSQKYGETSHLSKHSDPQMKDTLKAECQVFEIVRCENASAFAKGAVDSDMLSFWSSGKWSPQQHSALSTVVGHQFNTDSEGRMPTLLPLALLWSSPIEQADSDPA